MYNIVNGGLSSVTGDQYALHLTGSSGGNNPITFGLSNTNESLIAYIANSGKYEQWSDENMKNNIIEKTNYQDQLNKILKLKIVTYSYGKNHQPRIDEIKQQLQVENLDDNQKKTLQDELFDQQSILSETIQGQTYQGLEEKGFNYVTASKQIMNYQFLE